jgi:hypothetical protein
MQICMEPSVGVRCQATVERMSSTTEATAVPTLTDAADSTDLVIAKRLLDDAKQRGFTFQRAAPGVDAPLVGHRVGDDWADLIHIEGFSRNCFAWRQRISTLIVSQGALLQRQVEGGALEVLSEVLRWEL